MDWWTVLGVLGIPVGIVAGGFITRYYAKRATRELEQQTEQLKQRTEKLRQLTVTLMRILDGEGLIEVTKWDPVTEEPKSYKQRIRAGTVRSEPKVYPPKVTREDPPEEPKEANGN